MSYDRKIALSMRERKRMAFPLELKSVGEAGQFAGYASVFNVVDSHADVVEQGAFSGTIRGRESQIKLLWQHQTDEPIGVITRLFEDARGLYMEGQLLPEVARAKEALALLKAGALSGLSIGYSPTRYAIDPETGVRHLKAVELWEISLVTFPANAAAQVTVVKDVNVRSAASPRGGAQPALASLASPRLGLSGGVHVNMENITPATALPLLVALERAERVLL